MLRDSSNKHKVDDTARRKWKVGVAIIISLSSIAVVFFAWLFYVGSPKEIVAVADQFKPDSSWTFTGEHVRPPSTLCLDSVECPSLGRSWQSNKLITNEDLLHSLNASNWGHFIVEGDCEDTNLSSGTKLPVCSSKGVVAGYNVSISINKSASSTDTIVRLVILRR